MYLHTGGRNAAEKFLSSTASIKVGSSGTLNHWGGDSPE